MMAGVESNNQIYKSLSDGSKTHAVSGGDSPLSCNRFFSPFRSEPVAGCRLKRVDDRAGRFEQFWFVPVGDGFERAYEFCRCVCRE